MKEQLLIHQRLRQRHTARRTHDGGDWNHLGMWESDDPGLMG